MAMAEIALGRVISGPREISRDTLMERAACAATDGASSASAPATRSASRCATTLPFFETSYAVQRLAAYSAPVNWHGKT
jgi:hypothetical protein